MTDSLLLCHEGGHVFYQVNVENARPVKPVLGTIFRDDCFEKVRTEFERADDEWLSTHPNTNWFDLARINYEVEFDYRIIFDVKRLTFRRVPFAFASLYNSSTDSVHVDGVEVCGTRNVAYTTRSNMGCYMSINYLVSAGNKSLGDMVDFSQYNSFEKRRTLILDVGRVLCLQQTDVGKFCSALKVDNIL